MEFLLNQIWTFRIPNAVKNAGRLALNWDYCNMRRGKRCRMHQIEGVGEGAKPVFKPWGWNTKTAFGKMLETGDRVR